MTHAFWQRAFAVLSAILLLVMLGLLAFGGTLAAQDAYAHHLGPMLILFVAVTCVAAIAAWYFPDPRAFTVMALGSAAVGISLAVAFDAGLLWEPIVGFCVFCAAVALPAAFSIMWWPLRKLSYEERAAVFHRLLELPYDERMRIVMSRRYDRVLPRT